MASNESPPTYEEIQHQERLNLNKKIIQQIKNIIDKNITDKHKFLGDNEQRFISHIVKVFDKRYLYLGFNEDFDYIIHKLRVDRHNNNLWSIRDICDCFMH